MLNFLFWVLTFTGAAALLVFTWRSAMRRRGFKLVALLEKEGVLRQAVDVPVRIGTTAMSKGGSVLSRRGTLVLTRKRLAGITHRARWVLVRGGPVGSGAVRAEGEWLVIQYRATALSYRVGGAEEWARDAKRVLGAR